MQGDLVELIGEAPMGTLTQPSSQALPECLRYGFGLRAPYALSTVPPCRTASSRPASSRTIAAVTSVRWAAS